jgi:hypothetical protein
MPTDLTPAEKDDRQIERLIDKKPAPSRKPKGRGAPKHDNRRRRMKDHTDKETTDKDLSRKTQASRLFYIAARVAADTEEEEVHQPPAGPGEEAHRLINKFSHLLGLQSMKLQDAFDDFARQNYAQVALSKVGNPGKGKGNQNKAMLDAHKDLVNWMKKLIGIYEKTANTRFKGSPAEIAAQVAALWPNDKPNNWATRAGVLAALQESVKSLKAPASVKATALREAGNKKKGANLLGDVLKEASEGKISEDSIEDRTELATLVAAYRSLLDNPVRVDAADLVADIDKETERVYGEMQKLMAVPAFMKSWEKAIHELAKDDDPETITASEYYDEVQKSLKSFFKDDNDPVFDPGEFVDGIESFFGDDFKKAPEPLKKMVEGYRSAATSYGALRGKAMGQRIATYHGVRQQGDPTNGPYKGYQSIDKRYFGKEHYDSIVAHAKELLQEDWLKFEWDAGAKDAPFRAALDLSIHLADSNLYQGKIDGETYNMLLARLMGDKVDVFSETLITNDDTKSRRASAMSNVHYQNILRVASNLRDTDPRAALEIVKNLRSMVAQQQEQEQQEEEEQQGKTAQQEEQEEEQEQEGSHYSQQEQQGQQQQQGEQCAPGMAPSPPPAAGGPVQGQQQQSQISDKDMDEFVEGKVDIKDLKNHLKQIVDAKSIEDFVDGMTEMDDLLKKKTASGRVARRLAQQQQQQQGQQQQSQEQTGAIMDLEPLEDMDEEQVKAFLDKQKAEAQKLFQENDIEKFMEGMDAFFSEAEQAAKSVKTGSVVVSMSTLIRLAHTNPEARPVLLPIIIAAGKKKKKKEQRKKDKAKKKGKKGDKLNPFAKGGEKSKSGKGGKKPPFGGKKAPPFGGKKAPPFGKKKAAVTIDPSDIKW